MNLRFILRTHPISATNGLKTEANPLGPSVLGGKQLPMPLGDDFGGTLAHLDGAL